MPHKLFVDGKILDVGQELGSFSGGRAGTCLPIRWLDQRITKYSWDVCPSSSHKAVFALLVFAKVDFRAVGTGWFGFLTPLVVVAIWSALVAWAGVVEDEIFVLVVLFVEEDIALERDVLEIVPASEGDDYSCVCFACECVRGAYPDRDLG